MIICEEHCVIVIRELRQQVLKADHTPCCRFFAVVYIFRWCLAGFVCHQRNITLEFALHILLH